MKNLIIIFISIIIVFTIITSLAGILTVNDNNYHNFTTVRGEKIEIQQDGIYKYNTKALIAEGIAWDFVRLIIAVPSLIIGFILFLKRSLRGSLFLIGILAAMFYQYLLWAIGWAYNPLFLMYVILYSLSLFTIVLIVISIDTSDLLVSFSDKFPARKIGIFCISVGGILILLWCKEIIPSLYPNYIPKQFAGISTLFVQAADLGIIAPYAIFTGILTLKRNIFGYLLSSANMIFMMFMGLAIIAGVIYHSISTGNLDIVGLILFIILTLIAGYFLFVFMRNIKTGSVLPTK